MSRQLRWLAFIAAVCLTGCSTDAADHLSPLRDTRISPQSETGSDHGTPRRIRPRGTASLRPLRPVGLLAPSAEAQRPLWLASQDAGRSLREQAPQTAAGLTLSLGDLRQESEEKARDVPATEFANPFEDGSQITVRYAALRDPDGRPTGLAAAPSLTLVEPVISARLIGVDFALRIADNVRLLGGYSSGWATRGAGETAQQRDMSGVRSSAYSVGLAFDMVLAEDDLLGVVLTRPFRFDTTAVPDGQGHPGRSDGTLGGVAMDAELFYRLPLGDRATFGLNGILRFGPDHAGQGDGFGAGFVARYRLRL